MKSIFTTFPDLQSLPRGVKRMLLVSEDLFFSELKPRPASPAATYQTGGLTMAIPNSTNPLHSVHRPFQ